MTENKKLQTPIAYYGGKINLLPYLLPMIPEHKVYVEAYFGGWALFRAKQQSKVEIINDTNGSVVNFYEVLKNRYPALREKIEATLHSRDAYRKALMIYEMPRLFSNDPILRAWAFYIATNQGFVHKIGSRWFDKGSKAKTFKNRVDRFSESLSERLRHCQIESNPAHKVIESRDSEDTFFYLDPPYIGTNQGHYWGYEEEHFRRDLDVLTKIKGKFLLSSFPSKMLERYIKENGWYCKKLVKPLTAGIMRWQKRKLKVEVLTTNYPI